MVLSSVSIQLIWKQYGLCYFKHNSQSHVGERILLLLIMCKIIYQRKIFNNVHVSIWSMEQHVPFLGYTDLFKTYKHKSILDWWIIILRLMLSLWRICINFYHIDPTDDDTFTYEKLQFDFIFFQKSLNPILPRSLVTWYTSNGISSIIKCVNTRPTYP